MKIRVLLTGGTIGRAVKNGAISPSGNQEEKLEALRKIGRLYQDWQQAIDRWHIQLFLSLWAEKEVQQFAIDHTEL